MSKTSLGILLGIWLIFTTILACSIIGWILLFPVPNYTEYFMSLDRRRSTWMQVGIDLKDKLLTN